MQIMVIASPAIAPALPELAREFERVAGHVVSLTYATAGAMTSAMAQPSIDVVISTMEVIDALQAEDQLDGRRDIARVGLGVQTKRGAPEPDVSSVAAFRCAVLDARSLGYADPASGAAAGRHAARLMEQLGIGPAVAARTMLLSGSALLAAVACGDVELGLAPVSEILSEPAVALVGYVPSALQEMTVLTAAIRHSSSHRRAARAFVDFLSSAQTKKQLAERGFA
ncbi:MAG TPA: substrate-binding domain-containing protein [Burkholderiales bacterium]|nr:substrate-binding domain-containing protein [Burkholderiales bacterium]